MKSHVWILRKYGSKSGRCMKDSSGVYRMFYWKLSWCWSVLLLFCPVSSPRRFRAKVLSPNQLQVSWKEPKGEFEGYRVLYSAEPGEIQVQIPAGVLLVPSVQEPSRFNASTKISLNHKRSRRYTHSQIEYTGPQTQADCTAGVV